MILRKSALSCVRTNICQCRSISVTAFRTKDDRKNLPSRELFLQLTAKAHIDQQLARSGRKPFEIMVEKPIIVKNFFISEVESEEITFPVLINDETIKNWKQTNKKISKHLAKNITKNGNNQLDTLKEYNLFGYNVPKEYGGQEYSQTERSLASESESQNIAIAMALNGHRLVCQAITANGTEDQCAKYLPKLASGELIGTTAFQEWNDSKQTDLNTRAEYDEYDEEWCLNGTKSFVANASDARLLLVLVQTKVSDRQGDMKNALTMFIVDSTLPGVKVHPKDKTIGFTHLYQSKVTFNDVILAKDAVLSLPGTGQYLEKVIQMSARLNQGLVNLTQMKSILQYIVDMAQSIESQTANEEKSNQAVTLRNVLGKYSCSIYALESMLYLTTGIMDKYENTNIDLETAIFTTYSQDQLLNLTIELLNFVDTRVTLRDHPLNHLIRNAIQFKFCEPQNELKLHIGREGIRYRLIRLIEEIKLNKNKNFIIKNFLTDEQIHMYEEKLHPAALNLFASVNVLRLGASTLIEMEARDLQARDTEVRNIADAAACIYASYSCLLRSNRALKLNLPDADNECVIALTVCDRNATEVKQLMQYIQDGPVKTFEKYHEYVTHQLLENKFPAHPLTRLF